MVAYLSGVLTAEGENGRSQHSIGDVFNRTTEQLSIEIAERTRAIDKFEAAILASSVMNGIAVVAGHWLASTNGALDAPSRKVWDDLLDCLISSIRTGCATPS